MLIRCPNCASAYELAAEMLAEGRILRCAHCRDAWVYAAPRPGSAEPPARPRVDARFAGPEIVAEALFARSGPLSREADAAPSGPRRSGRAQDRLDAAKAQPKRGRRDPGRPARKAAAATLALGLAVMGGAMAAVAHRERVVATVPASAAVFATLGLPVNLRGLSFGDLHASVDGGGGAPILSVDAQITNLRQRATTVPLIRIAVRDKGQRELYHWAAPASKPLLGVGETITFHTRLSAPPRDGQELLVSFVEPAAAPLQVAEAVVRPR